MPRGIAEDAAAWLPGLGELQVVSGVQRFAVTVEVAADAEVNRGLAEEIAREVAEVVG